MKINNKELAVYEEIAVKIVEWLKRNVAKAGKTGGVFGLSGGIDSAVTAALCKRAFGDNCLGLLMPCNSNPADLEDAKLVAEALGIKTRQVDLSGTFEAMLKDFSCGESEVDYNDPAVFNIKPRLRMTALYYFAQKHNYLVIGTGNKSEILMGYFTKYGDGGVDLEPIGDLTKTQVWKLAECLGIPKKIIDRVPTAGLFNGQTDEDEMGMKYQLLDKIIECLEKGETPDCKEGHFERVKSVIKKMEHKTKAPPVCIVDRGIL